MLWRQYCIAYDRLFLKCKQLKEVYRTSFEFIALITAISFWQDGALKFSNKNNKWVVLASFVVTAHKKCHAVGCHVFIVLASPDKSLALCRKICI